MLVVAPLLHTVLAALLDKLTALPEHSEVLPLGVMVGIAGAAFTVTAKGVLTADEQPFAIVRTEYEVDEVGVTVIDCVVSPLLHTLPVATELCKVSAEPEQIVEAAPPTKLTVGVAGVWFTVTTTGALTADVQPRATACAV